MSRSRRRPEKDGSPFPSSFVSVSKVPLCSQVGKPESQDTLKFWVVLFILNFYRMYCDFRSDPFRSSTSLEGSYDSSRLTVLEHPGGRPVPFSWDAGKWTRVHVSQTGRTTVYVTVLGSSGTPLLPTRPCQKVRRSRPQDPLR